MTDEPLFEMPSYAQWVRQQVEDMMENGAPPSATVIARVIATRTPLSFLNAVAYRAAYEAARNLLRAEGRKAISTEDGIRYLQPELMEYSQLQGLLMANFDRRLADAASELRTVQAWCAAHPEAQLSPEQVYGQLGLMMPAEDAA